MLVAIILFSLFAIPAFIYRVVRYKGQARYFLLVAVAIDQLGNVVLGSLLNDILITNSGYKFGNPDETISGVLGKNYLLGTLTALGKFFCMLLGRIEVNHVTKSIEEDENFKG